MATKTKDEKYKKFLDDLRESGVVNMFGAGVYLQREFGLDRKEAQAVLFSWIKAFKN